MNFRQLDKKYFGRQGEPEDVVVGNSADSYLTDARGRKSATERPDFAAARLHSAG